MVRLPVVSAKRPLMKHQEDCRQWVLDNHLNSFGNFMEMRLGKTLVTIRLHSENWYPNPDEPCPFLVVAPITVLESWENELRLEREVYQVIYGTRKSKKIAAIDTVFNLPVRSWTLINYEALLTFPKICDLPWKSVILDESTKIKNPETRISKLCCDKFREARHRLVLSGLPSPENELNLFQQFKFMYGHFFGIDSFYTFRRMYFDTDMYGRAQVKSPQVREQIKQVAHKTSFVLNRNDAGLKGKKFKETRSVDMHEEQQEQYDQAETEFLAVVKDLDGNEEVKETSLAIVKQTWCARIAGGCDVSGNFKWDNKLSELKNILKGDLSNQPIVVWFRFNSEIEAAKKYLQEAGIACKTLYGTSDDEEIFATNKRDFRKQIIDWFRTCPTPGRVLLAQISLAKYGIDISVADTAIYYSMNYSTEAITQSEDRIYHPQKKSPLLYIYMVSKDSVDQDVIYAVNTKASNAKAFMQKFVESMTKRLTTRFANMGKDES